MKHLLAAALLLATSALADSPEAILKDYRKQAAQAVERLNQSLEKAATPLITKLVASGDTDGAALLTSQLKDKVAGEPVPTPQASAASLFAMYDEARAKALAPVQKSSVARIDSLLKTAGGPKLETVTELTKVREEIEAGKVDLASAATDIEARLKKTKWTWGYSAEAGGSTLTFGTRKTLQVNQDPVHNWKQTEALKITWDNETVMTFAADLKTFEVKMPNGSARRGRLLGKVEE